MKVITVHTATYLGDFMLACFRFPGHCTLWTERRRCAGCETVEEIGPGSRSQSPGSMYQRPGSTRTCQLLVTTPTFSTCLNQLAPSKSITVSFTHSAPWYTQELHTLKKRRWHLERLYKTIKLTVPYQSYKDHITIYKTASYTLT